MLNRLAFAALAFSGLRLGAASPSGHAGQFGRPSGRLSNKRPLCLCGRHLARAAELGFGSSTNTISLGTMASYGTSADIGWLSQGPRTQFVD